MRLPIYRVIQDIRAYVTWARLTNRERRSPDSGFNKFNMQKNFFHNVYVIVTLPQEQKDLPEDAKRLRVVERIAPINRYLDDELKFAGYLVPEFNQIYDKDTGLPTNTYVIMYRFAFNALSLKWVVTRGLLAAVIVKGIVEWQTILEWIKSVA